MSIKQLLAAAAMLLATLEALAGPFGLERGMTVAQLKAAGVDVSGLKDSTLKSATVPRPYAEFEAYWLKVDEKLGLCRIVAVTPDIPMNSFGTQLKDRFEEIKMALEQRYGPSAKLDFLLRGSIWNEPKDWSTALAKRERTFAAVWSTQGSAPRFVPRDNIAGIALEAVSMDRATGYVRATYEFNNSDECTRQGNQKKNSAL